MHKKFKKFLRTSAVVLIGAIAIATPLRSSAMMLDWDYEYKPINPLKSSSSYSDHFNWYATHPRDSGLACVFGEQQTGEKIERVYGSPTYYKVKIGESQSKYGTIKHYKDQVDYTPDHDRTVKVSWYTCQNCGRKSDKLPWTPETFYWRENTKTFVRTYTLEVDSNQPWVVPSRPCSSPKWKLDHDMLAIYENRDLKTGEIPEHYNGHANVQWAKLLMQMGNSAKDLDLKCGHKPENPWTYTIETPGCSGNCCLIL